VARGEAREWNEASRVGHIELMGYGEDLRCVAYAGWALQVLHESLEPTDLNTKPHAMRKRNAFIGRSASLAQPSEVESKGSALNTREMDRPMLCCH